MTYDELTFVLKYIDINVKREYEISRYTSFINAVLHGAKIKKPQQVITYPWEKEETPNLINDFSEEKQRQLLAALAKL